jgi:hypothetical protein
MTTINCPKCDADISESYEPDDWSCGIVGGWYCDACDLAIGEHEVDRGHDDDVVISRASSKPDGEIGTPISRLSGQPGQPGYAEFCRIARSWGFE